MCGCGTHIESGNYVKGHNARGQTREHNNNWRGGVRWKDGYKLIYEPDHPLAFKNGYVPEHRKIAAELYGLDIVRNNRVWWKDGDRINNSPDNLLVVTRSEYLLLLRSQQLEKR